MLHRAFATFGNRSVEDGLKLCSRDDITVIKRIDPCRESALAGN